MVTRPETGDGAGSQGWNLGLERGSGLGLRTESCLEWAGLVLSGGARGQTWEWDPINGGVVQAGPSGKPRACCWTGLGTRSAGESWDRAQQLGHGVGAGPGRMIGKDWGLWRGQDGAQVLGLRRESEG